MDEYWYQSRVESWNDKFTTPEKYAKKKLKMLKNDMCIYPTDEELAHLYSLKTEGDIDRAVSTIINRHWGMV